mgnify:CR=1 FL=1
MKPNLKTNPDRVFSKCRFVTYLAVSFHSNSPSSSSKSSSISENSGWGSWAGSFWSSPRINCTLWAGGVTARKTEKSGVFSNNLTDNKHSHADFFIFSWILCILRISIFVIGVGLYLHLSQDGLVAFMYIFFLWFWNKSILFELI